jgi:hypothetical protein
MSQTIAAADLAAMAKVAPEISKLAETESEWWLGLFGLDKVSTYKDRASWTWPRWRAHISTSVTAQMRLRVQPFERGDEHAIGVVLNIPEEQTEHYVGWARGALEEQVRRWVEFLNKEIVELRALWDAAGRPKTNTPPKASAPAASMESRTPSGGSDTGSSAPIIWHASATAPPSSTTYERPKDARVGRRLANERFEVTEWLGGDALMGAALARDQEHEGLVRLSFSADVAGSVEDVRALLAREIPGLAPIVYVGPAASDDGWAPGSMMVAEKLPTGGALLDLPTGVVNAREIAALGARMTRQLIEVHARGTVLGTIRPESMFVTSDGDITFVTCGERLFLMPRPNMMKAATLGPWRPGYQAPELFEMLPLLRDPPASADVFSLGVILGSALLGESVYYVFDLADLFISQRRGQHLLLPETPVGEILTRCLRPDATARPTLIELEQVLSRAPD